MYKKKAEEQQPVAAEEIKQTEPNLMAKKMFKSNISRRQNSGEQDDSGLFENDFNFSMKETPLEKK